MKRDIRQPVVVVLGHVDSGKTSLLDKIRGTAVQARELGGMTQHIGASYFPMETLERMSGHLLERLGRAVKVPGLLVIDTPGHEVFSNLRSRGGSAADISILVINSMRGFEVQTHESMEILRARKVPFVVALNKVDVIPGWKNVDVEDLLSLVGKKDKTVSDDLDERIYKVVGELSKAGINSEAYFRVSDFAQQVAIVPVSAKTGFGIPELIAVLIGLTQQYLGKKLTLKGGPARGIILEVKEEVGLGQTANAIILDGSLKVSDQIVLGKREGAVATKVRALFMPKPLDEMRDPRDMFLPIEEVHAAAGVKLVTADLEGVLVGSPLRGLKDPEALDEVKAKVEDEFKGLFVETETNGVVIKCDTLGSLEAILNILENRHLPVRIADIGPVTRRDVIEASAVKEKDDLLGAVLAFGVKTLPDASEEARVKGIRIFSENIIYNLVEGYQEWAERERQDRLRRGISSITPPCRFRILKDMVFRKSSPAVFGVEVEVGRLRQKVRVMNSKGTTVGTTHQLQDQGKNVEEAPSGAQVAVSMNEPTIGRQIREGQLLYTLPTSEEVRLLQERYREGLSLDESEVLEEIISIRRSTSPAYGF